MKKMETIYNKISNFNQARIITAIYEIVKENQGFLVSDFPYINTYKVKKIYNRTPQEIIRDNNELIEKAKEKNIKNDFINKKITEYEEAKEHINESIVTVFTNYINFVIDDVVYYFQFDDNPFFPYYKIKEKAEKKENYYLVKHNYYIEEIEEKLKNDIIDIIYNYLSDEEIKKIAKDIFNYLINCKFNEIVTDKKRVSNLYDNGYHYEHIKEIRNIKYQKIDII